MKAKTIMLILVAGLLIVEVAFAKEKII